jgi:molybdopterin molybdotransferase
MLPVSEAQHLVLQNTRRFEAVSRPAELILLGLVLAEDMVSDMDSPPFAKAMVDGYAFRAEDVRGQSSVLRIMGEVLAGQVFNGRVEAGTAVSIMTGAPIPTGADAVVMHERTELLENGQRIKIPGPAVPLQNVMAQGTEMKRGETVLFAGAAIRPEEFALLATLGKTSVAVYPRPRVGIISTGDEVVEPSAELKPGQIRNSNAYLLSAQAARAQGDVSYLGIARDNRDSLLTKIAEGLTFDVLVMTGGVSAGKVDLVPDALAEAGVKRIFHQVALKPGKPLYFGVTERTLVFGLPGNPVSSYVGFELFVRPALRKMMGRQESYLPVTISAQLTKEFRHKSDRPTYYPVQLERIGSEWRATPVGWRGSGDLRSVCQAQAFAVFPAGEHSYSSGANIDVIMTNSDT